MTVRIGFLGSGYMGQVAHLSNYVQIPGCAVTALAEVRPQLAQAVASRYGVPTVYDNYQALLADPNVDAVVCAQPFHYNYWFAKEVLGAGKSVFTEKPMVTRLEDGQEVIALAKAKRLQYAVGFMKRYDPGVQLAREYIRQVTQSGQLGKLSLIDVSCFLGDWLQSSPRPLATNETVPPLPFEPRYPAHISDAHAWSYDFFIETVSHDINLIRYLLPEEEVVCVNAVIHEDIGNALVFSVTLRSREVLITLRGSRTASYKWEEQAQFVFDKGVVTIRPPSPLNRQAVAQVKVQRQVDGLFEEVELHPKIEWAFLQQARGFVAAVEGSAPLLAPAQDGLRDVEIMEDIFRRAEYI